MINNLLDLVRLENSTNVAAKNTVNIDEMLKGLLTSVEHVARTKGIRLKSDFDTTERRLIVDQDRLEKIVLNLLLNAIKFTPADGTVSLTWEVTDQHFTLEVEDSGIGIGSEDLGHIFDRFWQANTSSTRKYQGVGIGLALVKELTESLGGQVKVESQLGTGSKFIVTLPAEFASEESLAITPAALSPDKNAEGNDEWLVSLYRRADLFIDSETEHPKTNHVDLIRRRRPLVLIGIDQPDMAAFIAAQLRTISIF